MMNAKPRGRCSATLIISDDNTGGSVLPSTTWSSKTKEYFKNHEIEMNMRTMPISVLACAIQSNKLKHAITSSGAVRKGKRRESRSADCIPRLKFQS